MIVARTFVARTFLSALVAPLAFAFASPWGAFACAAEPSPPAAASQPSVADVYAQRIKPLLRARCYACHGALRQNAGLRLDSAALILKGGESGPAVDPQRVDDSLLLARALAADPAQRMPPEGEGEPLSPEEAQWVRQWIAEGALAPPDEQPEADPLDHWAFRPVVRPALPRLAVASGGPGGSSSPSRSASLPEPARNPIDVFLSVERQRLGLTPQVEASRETLLRRLYFDLIGFPPTLEEIDACRRDPSADWYERLVDRLLADPRHGERWARHWMDVWRYSDWWGLGDQLRNSQKHIWHWRDWIVEAVNADMPYSEMVRLMLAADELHPNDLDKLRATGYLARNYFLFNRNQWMDEMVEHVGKGFLGLTTNCAKCHDHKYDPISHVDYYQMRAIFEPYHVRNDVVPGEPDLLQNGVPRAYDGVLDAPTWRLIRGQENQPDKSVAIQPGMPGCFDFAPFEVRAVTLPVEAWQPERRSWVSEGRRARAAERVSAAREALARLQDVSANEPSASSAGPTPGVSPTDKGPSEAGVAELRLAHALSELEAVELTSLAMQASWSAADGGSQDQAGVADAVRKNAVRKNAVRQTAQAASRAQRLADAAEARVALGEAELRLAGASEGHKKEAQEKVAVAREALAKAEEQTRSESQEYDKLAGAAWTPTRFLSSTQDDPDVAFPATSTGRRTALAQWIVDRRNPLTARVAANHLWTRHFGQSLAASTFDFGLKTGRPAHADLIDWLACELMDNQWSLKHMHRVLVTSAAYRMGSSAIDADLETARDPDNRSWWRRTPQRLESQTVRDALLSLAGLLDPKMGGPSIESEDQPKSHRRSLYFFHSHNSRNLFLTTFDEAGVKECYQRDESVVPQQALALLNSDLVHEASRHIARRISSGADDPFVRRAFELILGQPPSADERRACLEALAAWEKHACEGEAASNAAARTLQVRAQLVWALFNHNDFVTLR